MYGRLTGRLLTEHVTGDPNPVLLNAIDNTSANVWTTSAYKSSRIGRHLAKWLCYLQMDYGFEN